MFTLKNLTTQGDGMSNAMRLSMLVLVCLSTIGVQAYAASHSAVAVSLPEPSTLFICSAGAAFLGLFKK